MRTREKDIYLKDVPTMAVTLIFILLSYRNSRGLGEQREEGRVRENKRERYIYLKHVPTTAVTLISMFPPQRPEQPGVQLVAPGLGRHRHLRRHHRGVPQRLRRGEPPVDHPRRHSGPALQHRNTPRPLLPRPRAGLRPLRAAAEIPVAHGDGIADPVSRQHRHGQRGVHDDGFGIVDQLDVFRPLRFEPPCRRSG